MYVCCVMTVRMNWLFIHIGKVSWPKYGWDDNRTSWPALINICVVLNMCCILHHSQNYLVWFCSRCVGFMWNWLSFLGISKYYMIFFPKLGTDTILRKSFCQAIIERMNAFLQSDKQYAIKRIVFCSLDKSDVKMFHNMLASKS